MIFKLSDKKVGTYENQNGSGKYIFHLDDHLGGSNLNTDISGEVLQITDYLPYGKERITQRNTDYKNKYWFIGKEKDNESWLNYVEARYYDSNLGRFVAQDMVFWEVGQTKRWVEVMADPQQMNSYGYARNNPVILKDPSGETAILWDDVGTPLTNVAWLYVNTVIMAGVLLWKVIDNWIDTVSSMSKNVSSTWPNTTYQQQAQESRQSGAGSTTPAWNPALSQNSTISVSGSPSPGGGNNNGKKDNKKNGENKKDSSIKTRFWDMKLSEHAEIRMTERWITRELVQNTINKWEMFKYRKEGKILQWFYNSASKLFVWKWENITTVINNVSKNYINNLKSTIWK